MNPTSADLERLDNELAPVPKTPKELTPIDLIAMSIEKGLPPGELMTLAENWRKARAQEAFNRDMVACQGELPVLVHDSDNAFLKSTYLSLEGIQKRIKPIYSKHGFSLSWGQADSPRQGCVRVICAVMHVDGHVERFQGDYPLDGTGMKGGSNMNALQGTVSSNTYAQRDMIRSIFNLTIIGKDDDGVRLGDVLTPQQIEEVNTAFDRCEKAGNPVKLKAFLDWLSKAAKCEIASLDQMPQRTLDMALNFLKQKAAEVKK